MEKNDPAQRLIALRKAYQALPEETKRHVAQTVWKAASDLFTHWSKAAKTGYHNHEAAAARPTGIGRRLDDFLLKSTQGAWYIRRVANRFFLTEYWQWVERMLQGAQHENAATIAAKIDEILARPDSPWLGDPLEAFFRAAARIQPEDWLPDTRSIPPPTDGSAPSEIIPAAPVAPEEPWEAIWRDYSVAEAEATRLHDDGRNIRPFNSAAAIAAMGGLERQGVLLRNALADAAKAAGEPVPEWQTATQFKEHLLRLVAAPRISSVNGQRDKLLSLAAQIDSLVDTGSKTARKRLRVEETRLAASDELRSRATQDRPPALPGNDADWLRATFALPIEAIEARLAELREGGLTQLTTFIEEAEEWERFAVSTDAPVASPPPAAPPVPEPPAQPATAPSVKPATPKSVPAATHTTVAPISEPASKKPTHSPTAKPASVPPIPEIPPPSDFSSAVQALIDFDEIPEARSLLADVVACQPADTEAQLPAAELWRVLAMHPWLRQPEGEAPELVRAEFSRLLDADWTAHTESEAVIAWAAAIYPALLGQANDLIFILAQDNHLPPAIGHVTRLTATFLTQVPHCSPDRIASGTLHSSWMETFNRLRSELTQFCDAAAQQTINYQKATMIWRKLNAPGGRLRDLAVKAQGHLSADLLQKLRADATELGGLKYRQRLIEGIGRTLAGNYAGIDGAAFEQLSERIVDFASRVERLCEHASHEPTDSVYVAGKIREFSAEALPALRKIVQSPAPATASPLALLAGRIAQRAALEVLALFDTTAQPKHPAIPAFAQALALARLRVAPLRLDPLTGAIHGQQPATEIRHALRRAHFLTLADSIQRRLQVGDIANARRLREQSGFDESSADWAGIFEDARARHAQQCRKELEETRRDVLNARTLSVLTDSKAQEHLVGLTAAQKSIQDAEDYWSAHRVIDAIKADLDDVMLVEAAKLDEEMATLPAHPAAVRERFQSLLGAKDLATAREYITRLKTGQDLPPMGFDTALGGFTVEVQATIAAALKQGGDFDGFATKVKNKASFAGHNFDHLVATEHRELIEWLSAWRLLRAPNGLNRDMVHRWLAGLGFYPRDIKILNGKGQFSADVTVDPIANRDICAVPQFGSEAAGSYRLVHVASRPDPSQLLQLVEQAGAAAPVILLASGRIETVMRIEFARLCREKRRRALLVDDTLMVFLAGLERDRIATFFRATLPYTWVDPFVPTSSFVPPEIFFGRIDALDALLDPAKQRCFVYGGRQLGKTALLREVERRFPQQHDAGVALWIDLQAEDFGQSAEPEEVWGLLDARFCEKIPGYEALAREVKGAPATRVENALAKWLAADPKRRLLLLLDEGDKFLDRDAVNDFAETRRLKGIMDRSIRRFKVVFAGLHNVQRSTRQANHPLAHLGEPINIGAFTQNGEWMEAYALVAGPLAALGYQFASVDLPSRVLAACNFYPSLLQHFGHRLLERFRRQPCREIPQIIDAEAIDDVLREEEFRRFMTDRFQLTLQLDRRYYYIAYVFALFFHEAPVRAGAGYTAAEIRTGMEYWRPGEFASLGHEEFDSLLDEMQGLGLLQRGIDDHRYRLRNTNVLLLLGTSDEVLQRISEDIPDLRLDYHSRTSRGRVLGNRRRWLTRPQENRLFAREHRVNLLSAAPLAESAGLVESIRAGIGHPSFHLLDVANADKMKAALESLALEKLADGTHAVLIEPARGADFSCLPVARQFATTRKSTTRFFSLIVHVPAGRFWELEAQPWLADPALHAAFASRWPGEFVAPWLQDQSMQVSMRDVEELVRLTDGWPRLLHDFADEMKTRHSWAESIEVIQRKVQRWATEGGVADKFVGTGPAASEVWKHFREFYALEPNSFSTADVASYSELENLPAAQMLHWVDVACRLDLLERHPNTYRWTSLLGRVLSGK